MSRTFGYVIQFAVRRRVPIRFHRGITRRVSCTPSSFSRRSSWPLN